MADRPRLLLVPSMSELEWGRIRPLLEEWADVAAYDLPGLNGDEQGGGFSVERHVQRGIEELARHGWEEAIIVGDQFGSGLAVFVASAWQGTVRGLALGHACLTYTREGPRPALSALVADFQLQLTRLGRVQAEQMFVQGVEATYGPEVAAGIRERISPSFAKEFSEFLLANQDVRLEPPLRALDVPLLLAEHKECALWTAEGFEDAVAAFPNASTVSIADNPGASPEFASELREFAALAW